MDGLAKIIQSEMESENQSDSYFSKPKASTDELKFTIKSMPDFNLTDLGNAERLIYLFGDRILFNHTSKKFLIWNGKYWEEDNTRKIGDLAKETVRHIYLEAAECKDEKKRKDLGDFATKTESNQRIQAMIDLAKNDQSIAVKNEELDQNQWLLNLQNGTFNLKTLELQPHQKEDKITKITNIIFDPEAKAPQWGEFLKTIFNNNNNLIGFIHRAIAYSMTGNTAEQCFFLLYGKGANGKTTFINVIMHLLGDYAKQTPFDTILLKKDGSARNDLAGLFGTRFVSAVEGEQGRKMAESVIKQITGGDTISARKLYQDFFEYKPTYKLWLATNHKPVIQGTDHAIWRRVKLIPFIVQIPDEKQIKDYDQILIQEASGIFNLCVDALEYYYEKGLNIPDEVNNATGEYKDEMDQISNFIKDCCEVDKLNEVYSKDLYQSYMDWCNENGERPLSKKAIAASLKEKEFHLEKDRKGKKWYGIGLKM